MSASQGSAVIASLGMSCQSARQIRDNLDVISRRLNGEAAHDSQFFDGLIAPPVGLAKLFEDGFPLFSREDLDEGPGHPTWRPYGVRFLHHFREGEGAADIDRYFERDLSRFTYLREKFMRLKRARRLVFVLSNTQNNLDLVARETKLERISFDAAEVLRLQTAVQEFLGRACEFITVTSHERRGDLPSERVHILKPDDSEWTGDKRQWRAVFERSL